MPPCLAAPYDKRERPMKAVVYEEFQKMPTVQNVPDPTPSDDGVVIKVAATGVCRSDWHAWMGHAGGDLPHVSGHEFAGTIEAIGPNVKNWKVGGRVTVPFACGCGTCKECATGNTHVCPNQVQPGFSHWGSFAEYVAIEYAETNLVGLPEALDFVTAASLGCRFATSFRAVATQGRVSKGDWVAVHGCGGVGLSAIMIAHALGARLIAIDIAEDKLNFAKSLGAEEIINADTEKDIPQCIKQITNGGADVSIDALGNPKTAFDSVASLKIQGKHIQVGLLLGGENHPPMPMDDVIAKELEIIGSHGMQASAYPRMLDMIANDQLHPQKLVGDTITLEDAPAALADMNTFTGIGMKVIRLG
jgi:alcohol dehydrogenase